MTTSKRFQKGQPQKKDDYWMRDGSTEDLTTSSNDDGGGDYGSRSSSSSSGNDDCSDGDMGGDMGDYDYGDDDSGCHG